jgi:hypothetical protein
MHFNTGVYVLAGTDGGDSLDLVTHGAITSGSILFYTTDNPYAGGGDRQAGPIRLATTGHNTITFSSSPPIVPCPVGVQSYRGILFFANRHGPGFATPFTYNLGAYQNPDDYAPSAPALFDIQGGSGGINLSGALYHRYSGFEASGGSTITNTMMIFNVADMQNADGFDISGQDCVGMAGLPRLMR